VEAQTHDGRKLRLTTLIDEYTRECLAIRVALGKLALTFNEVPQELQSQRYSRGGRIPGRKDSSARSFAGGAKSQSGFRPLTPTMHPSS
jgi:hypothetical protein